MSTTLRPAAPVPPDVLPPRRPGWILGGICALAALLYAWGIDAGTWGNVYYSAAVRSMSTDATALLFGTFDPVGVITVDKPPMALWPQVLSVWIFGFHSWALLLPQVVAGVAAVPILHRAVRRWAGERAALLAALVLALTPITVAINRDNNPDTLLTLFLVAAAYTLTRAVGDDVAARAATGWLTLTAFLVGCGFLTKMLQAWVIVPVLALAYLVGRTAPLVRRLGDLALAGLVLAVSSLWWMVLVDLWPRPKPFIGGSTDGSAFDLIVGYNGLGRVVGQSVGPGGDAPQGPMPGPAAMAGIFGGEPGPLRLANPMLATQIGWLLPLCLLVPAFVAWRAVRSRHPMRPADRAGWVLWGGWLLLAGIVFSLARGIFHPYYTTMLAPAVAALAGAGLELFRREQRSGTGPSRYLFALAVAVTAVWSVVLLTRDGSFLTGLRVVVGAGAVAAVAGTVLALRRGRRGRAAAVLGVVTMLLGPASWSAVTAVMPPIPMLSGVNPTAGPPVLPGFGGDGGSAMPPGFAPPPGFGPPADVADGPPDPERMAEMMDSMGMGGGLSATQRAILDHAAAHSGGSPITLAVEGPAIMTAGWILHGDRPVVGMGGFLGADPAPTAAGLAEWVRDGRVRFVVLGMSFGPPSDRGGWVEQHCAPVPPQVYGGTAATPGPGMELYDCRPDRTG